MCIAGPAITKVILSSVDSASTFALIFGAFAAIQNLSELFIDPLRGQYNDRSGRKPLLILSG